MNFGMGKLCYAEYMLYCNKGNVSLSIFASMKRHILFLLKPQLKSQIWIGILAIGN